MSRQTAVESIIEELKEHIRQSANNELGTNRTGDYRIGLTKAINFCEQTKEMEKQQIIDGCNQTQFEDIDGMGIHQTITKGEQYYNETFKN